MRPIKITNVLLIRIGLWILGVSEFLRQWAEFRIMPFDLFMQWVGLALIFDPMYCSLIDFFEFEEGD